MNATQKKQARAMLKAGLSRDAIARALKITIDQVREIETPPKAAAKAAPPPAPPRDDAAAIEVHRRLRAIRPGGGALEIGGTSKIPAAYPPPRARGPRRVGL
jgi:hypothetical protein